jgi:hypothetical protein
MAGKKQSSFVLDREACLFCAANPNCLNLLKGGSAKPKIYTLSSIRKVIRKMDSGVMWNSLEQAVGLSCYPEDASFFAMCGSLRQAANALSPARANFEEEKLQVIAVARILNCTIITRDTSTSSSSMLQISARFAVKTYPL